MDCKNCIHYKNSRAVAGLELVFCRLVHSPITVEATEHCAYHNVSFEDVNSCLNCKHFNSNICKCNLLNEEKSPLYSCKFYNK